MSSPPTATTAARTRSGPGCLVLAVLFPIVILAGIVIGTVLNRPEDPPEEKVVTVADGTTVDGTEWRVDAIRDIEGEVCAFLYEDGAQLTGACDSTPQDATFGDETVVFGQTDPSTTSIRVILNNADTVEIDAVEAPGIEGRFYAEVVDGDVDVERLATP
ncbi:MAG: hypothetical protein ABWZ76_07545 [Acidimicrobiales bacterium]